MEKKIAALESTHELKVFRKWFTENLLPKIEGEADPQVGVDLLFRLALTIDRVKRSERQKEAMRQVVRESISDKRTTH